MNYSDEEKRRINNEVMTKANPKLMTNSTLCWLCKHCIGGHGCPCSKTNYGEPVAGWRAEDSKIHPGEAWCVKACPLFDFNYSLRWEISTVMPLLVQWCKTTTGKPLYYKAVSRDPAKWIDQYNEQMPRSMQIDPMMEDEEEDDDDDFEYDENAVLGMPTTQDETEPDRFAELFKDELENDSEYVNESLFEDEV